VKWLNENPNRPAWSWSIESTSEAVRNYLFRGVYGGVMVETGTQAGAYFKPVNFQALQKAGIAYVKESVRLMGWVNVIMIALGGFWWFKQRKQHTPIDHFFGWSLLLLGPGLAAYLGGNEGVDYQVRAMTERMYLMGYQLMGLMMPLGISWLHSKLSNHIQLRRWLWGLGIILIGVNVWSSLKVVKAQNQPLAYSLSKEALLKVEEKSVIWCFGDISCFSLIYLQQIEGLRPDVTVLTQSPYLQKAKTKEAVDIKQTGNYPDNPFRISDITATSLKYGRAVYVAELPDFYRQWLGLDQGILSARKDGLLMKLGCDFAGHQNSEVVIKPPIEETNSSYLRSIYQAYMKSVDLKTDCFWRNKSDQCATTDWACQTQIVLWQLLRDPEDIEARLNLAKAYEGGGFYPLAKREYEIVLTLEPENQEASEGAKRLKDEVLK